MASRGIIRIITILLSTTFQNKSSSGYSKYTSFKNKEVVSVITNSFQWSKFLAFNLTLKWCYGEQQYKCLHNFLVPHFGTSFVLILKIQIFLCKIIVFMGKSTNLTVSLANSTRCVEEISQTQTKQGESAEAMLSHIRDFGFWKLCRNKLPTETHKLYDFNQKRFEI